MGKFVLDYKALGARIKKCRKAMSITQEKLAELSNVTTNFIAKIETGSATTSLQTIITLANVLNTSIDFLFLNIDYMAYENADKEDENIDIAIKAMLDTFDTDDKQFLLGIMKDIKDYKYTLSLNIKKRV